MTWHGAAPCLQKVEAHEENPFSSPVENVVSHPGTDEPAVTPIAATSTMYIDVFLFLAEKAAPAYFGEGIIDTPNIEMLCSKGGALDWLNDSEEKTYSPEDGMPV